MLFEFYVSRATPQVSSYSNDIYIRTTTAVSLGSPSDPPSLEDCSVLPGLGVIFISIVGRFSPRFRFFEAVCVRTVLVLAFPFTTGDLCEPSWVQIFFFLSFSKETIRFSDLVVLNYLRIAGFLVGSQQARSQKKLNVCF
jgi:hypothetical protein